MQLQRPALGQPAQPVLRGLSAGLVDGLHVGDPEQQRSRRPLNTRVITEEGLDIALESAFQVLVGFAPLELVEDEVDFEVRCSRFAGVLNGIGIFPALDESQGFAERPETFSEWQQIFDLGFVRVAPEGQPLRPQSLQRLSVLFVFLRRPVAPDLSVTLRRPGRRSRLVLIPV